MHTDLQPALRQNTWRNIRGVDSPRFFRNVPIVKAGEGNGLSVGPDSLVYACNPKGAIAVLPLDAITSPTPPLNRLVAHSDAVTDLKYSPHFSDLIASSGANGSLHIAKLLDNSAQIVSAWSAPSAHAKKCVTITWNPVATHVLASAGLDQTVKIWDLDSGAHSLSVALSASFWQAEWLADGKLIAGMGQDNKCRILDVRSKGVAAESPQAVYSSSKPSQCTVLASENGVDPKLVVAVGFEGMGKRQLKTFDIRNLSDPILSTAFPGAAAHSSFHYSAGPSILFISSQGDNRITVLSVTGTELSSLPEVTLPKQAGSLSFMPEQAVDIMHTEIARCYRTETENQAIRQLSFHCGKADEARFQEQYYGRGSLRVPDNVPAAYWFKGGNGVPLFVPYRQDGVETAKLCEITQCLNWNSYHAPTEIDTARSNSVKDIDAASLISLEDFNQPCPNNAKLAQQIDSSSETPMPVELVAPIPEPAGKLPLPATNPPAGLTPTSTLSSAIQAPSPPSVTESTLSKKCARCFGCL